MNKTEIKEYEESLKVYRDWYSIIETARKEAREEEKARSDAAIAKEKAEKEVAQAELKAIAEKTVINSHQAGLTVDTIATVTGLTSEEIITILKRLSS